jgi:YjjG family noncanonical pyrimidine nucleotidase
MYGAKFMKYEFLLFDADHTLFDFNKSEYFALKNALEAYGLPNGDEIIERYSVINVKYWKMLERGEIDKKSLMLARFVELGEEFGFADKAEALSVLYMENLAREAHLFEGALEMVTRLAKNYRLFIITNGVKSTQDGRFGLSPITKYFEKIFISEIIGAEKPSKIFFDAVESGIDGYDRDRAIVIGDSLSSDIKGALGSGIDCIWFNPTGKEAPEGWDITYTVKSFDEILKILEN